MTAKIIQFPGRKNSVAYDNMIHFFEACDSVESCNFYLEAVENLAAKGNISEREMYTLRRIGRQKRLELVQPPVQEPQEVNGAGVYSYTTEMGQNRPECQMEARRAYYGNHFFVDTPLELKGRGIKLLKTYEEKDFCQPNDRRAGWSEYQVTEKAFEKLKQQYSISRENCLD